MDKIDNNSTTKDFKYTIKTKEGKVLVQSIVTFGSPDRPFPSDWKEQPIVSIQLQEYKETFIKKYFDVEISENLDFDTISMYNDKDILEKIKESLSNIGNKHITGNDVLCIIDNIIDKKHTIPNEVIEAQKYVLKCQNDIGFMGSPEYDKQKKIVDDYNEVIKEKEERETYLRLKSKYENL